MSASTQDLREHLAPVSSDHLQRELLVRAILKSGLCIAAADAALERMRAKQDARHREIVALDLRIARKAGGAS